jgi:formate hydrogenlyase subunit 6/NADH:ubiquinone oxidoreductase subunit I
MRQFLGDIYEGMRTFLVGMKVTGRYLFDNTRLSPKDVTTVTYDGTEAEARKVVVAERFRGHLHNDIQRCIVCKQCARICPVECFWIEGERTEASRQRPSRFEIDLLRCMYCGLCVTVCPTHCLTMTREWWGATRAGTPDSRGGRRNLHGLLREFGVGFYTPEQKEEVERKRLAAEEARRREAAKPENGAEGRP